MVTICNENLAQLKAAGIQTAAYDRAACGASLVHIGVGGFHRAHQAVFTDDVLYFDSAWGICGVNLFPFDVKMRDVTTAQDRLYTVWARGSSTDNVRIVGSHVEYLHYPDDPSAVLSKLSDPETKLVTLTITEKGYCLDLATGRLDKNLPAVNADVASLIAGKGEQASTALGILVASFARRCKAGLGGITVLSCDNVQENGQRAREAIIGLAELVDSSLASWIREKVSFPNSMVDRITPATTPELIAELKEKHNVVDRWPVVCEDFALWVIEDNFVCGRPAWEKATIGKCLFVKDVVPYELIKLRLLNAAHQAIGYAGVLLGYRKVHEAMADELVKNYITLFQDVAGETCQPVPGMDLAAWKSSVRDRFANSSVQDQLLRLTEDGRNRIQVAVVPCSAAVDKRPVAVVIACWIRYLAKNLDVKGENYAISPDTAMDTLKPIVDEVLDNPAKDGVVRFINSAFGANSSDAMVLADEVTLRLMRIQAVGVREMLAELFVESKGGYAS